MAKKLMEIKDSQELVAMPNVNTSTGELTYPEGFVQTQTIIAPSNIFQLAGRLKALKNKTKGIAISTKYLEMTKEGQEIRGIFLRYKFIHKKDDTKYRNIEEVPENERHSYFEKERVLYKKIECVEFIQDNGEVSMMGGVQFINSFKEQNVPTGTEFYAKYEGTKNKTKIFEIFTFEEIEETTFELVD